MDNYDVAIIGAGPAGSATALQLRELGVQRVILVEAGQFAEVRIGESIPPDTRKLLDKLGLLSAFLKEEHEPCVGSCASWGDTELGHNDFAVNVYGSGWHLDRTRFDSFLAHEAAARGTHLKKEWLFTEAKSQEDGGYALTFETPSGGRQISAGLVVDATGRKARFARQAGARNEIDDQLICVSAMFRLDENADLNRLTMLEACPYGWWYAARLADRAAVVAVATDAKICKRLSLRKTDSWLWHLASTRHIAPRLEKATFESTSLKPYPALSRRLNKVGGANWLAVGDAATCYDPVAAQGIYKAIASGIMAGHHVFARHAGKVNDFSGYCSRVIHGYREFLQLRHHLYSQEQRWANQPFWQTRHTQSAAATVTTTSLG